MAPYFDACLRNHPRDTLFIRVHLKSITNGAVHPAAVKGGVLVHTARHPGRHSYAIQTSEDLLGLLVRGELEELLVWNWKTGSLRLVRVLQLRPVRFAHLASSMSLVNTCLPSRFSPPVMSC